MSAYQRSNSSNDEYIVELLKDAIMHVDQNARIEVQQRLDGVVCGWLYRHSNREALYQLDNIENYIGAAFERFWQVTIDQQEAFSTLAAALQYLSVSLNGVILETLRAFSRPKEVLLTQSTFPGETLEEDVTSSNVVSERLQAELLNVRESRLAYLLFHCGLKPWEIVQCCSREFSNVREINSLRRTLLERLLRN